MRRRISIRGCVCPSVRPCVRMLSRINCPRGPVPMTEAGPCYSILWDYWNYFASIYNCLINNFHCLISNVRCFKKCIHHFKKYIKEIISVKFSLNLKKNNQRFFFVFWCIPPSSKWKFALMNKIKLFDSRFNKTILNAIWLIILKNTRKNLDL